MRQPKNLIKIRIEIKHEYIKLTNWFDALTSNINFGFIETIVWPDIESETRVHTRLPVSAFQQWIRPSLAPKFISIE